MHDGVLAVAVPQGDEDTAPGKVVFFDTDGTFLSAVTVGALPDMVKFTPNGAMVLTANEGQPMGDYSSIPKAASASSTWRRRGIADKRRRHDRRLHGVQPRGDRPAHPHLRSRRHASRRISSPSTSRSRTTRRRRG